MQWSSTVGTGYCQANSPENKLNSNGNTLECDNPKGGSDQDTASDCSPLGLYNCSYNLPCNATSPCSENDVDLGFLGCQGKREIVPCSYQRTGTCVPNNTGWNSSCNTSGTYRIGCDSGSCQVSCERRCRVPCTHTCYDYEQCCDTCHNCCDGSDPSCIETNNCAHDCNCRNCKPYNPHDCHSCHEYEYRSMQGAHTVYFSGTCGAPSSGSCRKKTHKPIASESKTCSLSRIVSGCSTPIPPVRCTASDEYTTRPLCEVSLPPDKECYLTGNCWKRRDVGGPSCSGGYDTLDLCQAGLPDHQECYERSGCWRRRNRGVPQNCSDPDCYIACGSCHCYNRSKGTCSENNGSPDRWHCAKRNDDFSSGCELSDNEFLGRKWHSKNCQVWHKTWTCTHEGTTVNRCWKHTKARRKTSCGDGDP